MRAGQLRHKVTLQDLGARVDDGYGGGTVPITDVAEVRASIEPLTGRERLQAGQFDTSITHRVRLRYYPGIKPHWRVAYQDNAADTERVFDIKSVADLEERHREIELMCEELLTW